MVPAPKFDPRTSREVYRELRAILSASGWLRGDEKKGSIEALGRVFARFAELVIHRLNQAPEKNFLAFLDLLGVAQLPMQAARVPLTFLMAPKNLDCVTVPAGSQVAAAPPEGEKKPLIFETERELVLTPARLDSLLSKSGGRDQCRDFGQILSAPLGSAEAGAGLAEWHMPEPMHIPHAFYMALPVNASWPKIDGLRVRVELDDGKTASGDERLLQWEIPAQNPPQAATSQDNIPSATATPSQPEPKVLSPQEDTTKNLTQSGDIIFQNFSVLAPSAIEGVSGNWLGCRLLTPITPDAAPAASMVRASQLPVIKQITCEMDLSRQGLAIEQAFYNAQKLDLSKDFFPFGERPKFSDVLYLASREVFSDADAKITLHVELTNPESASLDIGIPNTSTHNTQLSWEFWNGQGWMPLGKTGRFLRIGDAAAEIGETEFADGTKSLSNNGDVSFQFPCPPQPMIVNGQKNYWIRVRIAAGSYGEPFHFEKGAAASGMVAKPATLAPPSIRSIKLDYVVKKTAAPAALITDNDFSYAHVPTASSFKPFLPVSAENVSPAVYFGFTVGLPSADKSNAATSQMQGKTKFANRPVTVYLAVEQGEESAQRLQKIMPSDWQYWNGSAWAKLSVRDETQSFQRSGLIQFIPPEDFTTKEEFGRERYWLRMHPDAEGAETAIRRVELNTIMAIQGISVLDDLLGTSDGKPNQKFRTIRSMVLAGQKLEVREPTLPPKSEREAVQAAEGPESIQPVKDPATQTDQYWVTWHEVTNFYGSGPRDRHYVLDHVTGELTFGDGTFGFIPPVVPGNIRMKRYYSGGGSAGNVAAGAITKLNAAIPGVQKVVNPLPASGGSDAEQYAKLLERGSRGIRHGQRAVTLEDYEDLAMLASREVTRAKSVPFYDLSVSADARRFRPGIISVIVLPDSTSPKPMPSPGLLECVRDYLDRHRLPTVDLVVAAPDYVSVDVDAEIAVDDIATAHDVEVAVNQELARYLHPVTGGIEGNGWEFGQLPRKFDLTVLIERVPGVSYVRDLRVNPGTAMSAAQKTRHRMVCCGRLRITTILEEARAVEFA